MQAQAAVKAEKVDYHGGEDVTVWLERLNGNHEPVIYPYWPQNRDRVAVCLQWDDRMDPPYMIHVPLNEEAMLEIPGDGRLWFCNIPLDEFCRDTSAEPEWF